MLHAFSMHNILSTTRSVQSFFSCFPPTHRTSEAPIPSQAQCGLTERGPKSQYSCSSMLGAREPASSSLTWDRWAIAPCRLACGTWEAMGMISQFDHRRRSRGWAYDTRRENSATSNMKDLGKTSKKQRPCRYMRECKLLVFVLRDQRLRNGSSHALQQGLCKYAREQVWTAASCCPEHASPRPSAPELPLS
jgi:hypothetical protein